MKSLSLSWPNQLATLSLLGQLSSHPSLPGIPGWFGNLPSMLAGLCTGCSCRPDNLPWDPVSPAQQHSTHLTLPALDLSLQALQFTAIAGPSPLQAP